MTLVSNLTQLQARLLALPSRFGVPTYVPVTLGGQAIDPNPKVEQVSPNEVGKYLTETILITGTEVWLEIPRLYPETNLLTQEWIVEGKRYKCLWVDKRKPTTYRALLGLRGVR